MDKKDLRDSLIWMDILRTLAVCGVVMHHWLLFIPYQKTFPVFAFLAIVLRDLEGTIVHLFFILSGAGLTLSYFKRKKFNSFGWNNWVGRRIEKIILPYAIILIATYLFAIMSNKSIISNGSYSGFAVFFFYITFLRNFYAQGYDFNPTLWFMPVIVGLYFLFPFLLKCLKKSGSSLLLVISFVITYSSITFCIVAGYTVSHQSALPLFYVFEFSLGMMLGYSIWIKSNLLERLMNLQFVILAIFLYILSWILSRSTEYGAAYNDVFTAVSVFTIMYNMALMIVKFFPHLLVKAFRKISVVSYIMYLIHGPIILYVLRPILKKNGTLPMHPGISILCSILFAASIYFIALFISPGIKKISDSIFRM